MITFPAKFAAENAKSRSKPCVLVKLGTSNLESIQSSQGDWEANTAETQVDYAISPGNVWIEGDTVPGINETTEDTVLQVGGDSTLGNIYNGWQSFKTNISGNTNLDTIDIGYYASNGVFGTPALMTAYAQIYQTKLGTALSTVLSATILSAFPTNFQSLSFDFSSQNIEIEAGVEYWIKIYGATTSDLRGLFLAYDSTKPYADGQLDRVGATSAADIGDAYFSVSYTGGYYLTSGSITTQIIDLGEIPTTDGEWKMVDQTPSDYGTTTLTYTAYGSTDNFSASNVTIGTVVDGGIITGGDLYRYYKLKADFTTTDESETPILESMGLSFVSYINIQDQITPLLYGPSLKEISSLTTEIDDFALTQIGQLTLKIGNTELIDNYFSTIVVKNKPVRVLLGFNEPGFVETDYAPFYYGVIDDFQMVGRDYSVVIKDNTANWNFKVPREISTAGNQSAPTYQTDITASGDHHADVILNILQNYLSVRDSTVDFGSFETVKDAKEFWKVTRVIAGEDAENASEFINQLRVLLGAYFVPQANGQIKIKLYDAAESTIGSIGLNTNIKRPGFDAKLDELINKTSVLWDFNTSTELWDALYIGIDASSQTNTDEVFTWEFEDYWTQAESTDFDEWINYESVDDSVLWYDVVYGAKWVVVGNSGDINCVMYSDDGLEWFLTEAVQIAEYRAVGYGNGRYVALAYGSNIAMYSDDGETWAQGTISITSNWQSITYGNSLFVAVSDEFGVHEAVYSSDGITWTEAATTITGIWTGVDYGASLFTAVGVSGAVMTSPDGDTWTTRTAAAALNWNDVAWAASLTLFVAVSDSGTGNRVMTSPDGINWTGRTSAADNSWRSVVFGDGNFVAVASSGTGDRIMTSPDGINWTGRTSAADENWWSIATDGELFISTNITSVSKKLMRVAANQGEAQQRTLQSRLLTRYAEDPNELKMQLDRKNLAWEVADMISITTDQAPGGTSAQKYQIKRKNFAPLGNKINFTFKKVT